MATQAGTRTRTGSGPPWAWRLVVGVVRWVLVRLFGWRVRAELPEVRPEPGQPLVVVFNHTSNIDAFLVADVVWRRLRHWCQPLGKAEAFAIPVIGTLGHLAGAIPVSRADDAGREQAFGAAVERLAGGGTIMIAPEGTVTHDGSLLPLRHGAARLALDGGAHVLVVTHFGAQRGFSPVVRLPDRGAVVTMVMDLLVPWDDEDESSLTGRIAATMLDRSEELRAAYPQADPDAPWWPPYARPASPSAHARENLERYRASMTDAVTQARERMTAFAEEHHLEERAAEARARAAEARERLAAFAEEHHLDERARAAAERAVDARERARDAAEELAELARERARLLREQARERLEERRRPVDD